MASEDFDLLPLQPVTLSLHEVLLSAEKPASHVCFVESGFASVTTDEALGQVEVGMIGREGLIGAVPVLLRADRSPLSCSVQRPGQGYRVAVPDLESAVARSPGLHALLLRYVQAVVVQGAFTAYSNAGFTIEVRLARWLLMCHDRSDDDVLLVTHGFLSTMLGVRRPGVTVAVQVLEGHGLVRARRGRITVLDRAGLRALAGRSYGLAEAEYERLLPARGAHAVTAPV
jgi:CRP-like cAMP-binding protein